MGSGGAARALLSREQKPSWCKQAQDSCPSIVPFEACGPANARASEMLTALSEPHWASAEGWLAGERPLCSRPWAWTQGRQIPFLGQFCLLPAPVGTSASLSWNPSKQAAKRPSYDVLGSINDLVDVDMRKSCWNMLDTIYASSIITWPKSLMQFSFWKESLLKHPHSWHP